MTVAVSCVQSAISLEAETPAFFFSAWSKHVLTASHSILKHLQLGADEDIKKTHPKHLHQPAVKNLLLSPALPCCRGSSSSLFLAAQQKYSWLHMLHTDKITAIKSSSSASQATYTNYHGSFCSCTSAACCVNTSMGTQTWKQLTCTQVHHPTHFEHIHKMTYAQSIANKTLTRIIKKTVEIMTRREKKREGWQKGGVDVEKGGQLCKEDCSVPQCQGAGSGQSCGVPQRDAEIGEWIWRQK